MAKLEEYRKHAKECRMLAKKLGVGYGRQLLIKMAQDWISLANCAEPSHPTGQGAIKGPDVV